MHLYEEKVMDIYTESFVATKKANLTIDECDLHATKAVNKFKEAFPKKDYLQKKRGTIIQVFCQPLPGDFNGLENISDMVIERVMCPIRLEDIIGIIDTTEPYNLNGLMEFQKEIIEYCGIKSIVITDRGASFYLYSSAEYIDNECAVNDFPFINNIIYHDPEIVDNVGFLNDEGYQKILSSILERRTKLHDDFGG